MLNTSTIKSAMQTLGLSQAAIAKTCDVSKEAVSNWLSGESLPRPNKLKSLASALQLDVATLLAPSAIPDPVVAYRTRKNRSVTGAASEAAMDVGEHLRQLVPFIQRDAIFAPPVLLEPKSDITYIREVTRQIRSKVGISSTAPLNRHLLLELLHDFGAILVPVQWGKDKDGHENALSVYLPDSRTSWVVFNLNSRDDDFNYWLAHELGHCYTLHALQGDAGEEFAEAFAKELLFPLEAAREALTVIKSDSSPQERQERANWYAGKFEVSVVTIIRQADQVAKLQKETVTELENTPFWDSWNSTRHLVPTVTEALFGRKSLSAAEYVLECETVFKTPLFRALASWQRQEGGRSPAFIAGALNISVPHAIEISHVLQSLQQSAVQSEDSLNSLS